MSGTPPRQLAPTDREGPHVVHVTTIAMSLRYLLLNQLLAIRDAGYRVTTMSAPGPDTGVLEDAGIPHVAVPLNRKTFTPVRDVRATWHLFRAFRRMRPTIVHTHNPKPGLWGQVAARLAGVPCVVNTIHGFYFHEDTAAHVRRALIGIERLAAKFSDRILCQNPEDVQTALHEGICPEDKISLLGNGVDLSRFDPTRFDAGTRARIRGGLGVPQDAVVVGFVGRLVHEKGLAELLEAARSVAARSPRARFLFVGEPDMHRPDAFDPTSIVDHGPDTFAHFVGHRQDMAAMYSAMDVFCLPSHREGFPRSAMEASAMGLPSVVTDIRGCRQVVNDGQTGYLVPVRDSARLAEALSKLVADEGLRRELGAHARLRAGQEFDERRVFARVLHTYASFMDAKTTSAS